jgi:acyl-CoA oxidase
VTKDGEYKLSPDSDPSMLYVVLLDGRIQILKSAAYFLSKALTIAIRYAVVRT